MGRHVSEPFTFCAIAIEAMEANNAIEIRIFFIICFIKN
jgi:hypothetical protein